MKAILCTRPGGPDDLIYTDLPEPQAGPGEAVVDVKAAALNFFDTLIIANKYQIKPAFPFSPSAEFAGVVRSVGSGVRGLAPGDSVLGYLGHGCARERLAAPAERLAPLPPGFDFDRAAGLSIVYGTTYHALKDRARLRPGETLAVLGAAGGVGLAAVEIGKLMGARVIACASSDDKCAFARRHGADETINYGTTDLKTALKAATGGRGADVVYDPVGGDFTETAVRATAWNGRFLVIGFAAGTIPKLPLNLVLLKGIDLCGVYWGAFAEREPAAQRANMAQIVAWCTQGKLSSHVHEVYPLAQTAQALKDIAARKIMGKAILHP
ncbi:MAG: NADPH:quinone oxidoreductase family protein [Pseudorhodoplanes sp.]|nr:NADPH:quinone oxidoreductase family protein [Pseudorhodoplanes sp.]